MQRWHWLEDRGMDFPEEVDKKGHGGRAIGCRDEDKGQKFTRLLTLYNSSVLILLHLFITFIFPLLKILLRR